MSTLSDKEIRMIKEAVGEFETTVREKPSPKGPFAHGKRIQIVKKALYKVLRLFAERVKETFSLKLRKPVVADALYPEIQTFSELLDMFPSSCWVSILNIPSLGAEGYLLMETELVYALLDAFCGGHGAAERRDKPFMAYIERSMAMKIAEEVIGEFKRSWNDIFPSIDVDHKGAEYRLDMAARPYPATEGFVLLPVRVEFSDLSSVLNVFLPMFSLEPVLGFLELEVDRGKGLNVPVAEELLGVNVELRAVLGEIGISLSRLARLKEGEVLFVDEGLGEGVVVLVEGVPKFRGFPVKVRGKKGVEIVEKVERLDEIIDAGGGYGQTQGAERGAKEDSGGD